MALSTSVNWVSNFIVAFITPPLFGSIQGGYYFLLLGFTCISGVFVYFVYPETAGKTLEELGEVFGDKTVDAGAELGGGDVGDVDVAEKELNGEDLIEDMTDDGAEVADGGEESDEDEMVDIDVNSVDEETTRPRELDGEVHRELLEASSEVTLPVPGSEVDAETKGEAEGKKLEDVD
jgi:hypothetical protein